MGVAFGAGAQPGQAGLGLGEKKLYQRQGVAQYWVVDPDAECVEVWDFQSSSDTPARYVDRLPVRIAGHTIGEIDLPDIFSPEL